MHHFACDFCLEVDQDVVRVPNDPYHEALHLIEYDHYLVFSEGVWMEVVVVENRVRVIVIVLGIVAVPLAFDEQSDRAEVACP